VRGALLRRSRVACGGDKKQDQKEKQLRMQLQGMRHVRDLPQKISEK